MMKRTFPLARGLMTLVLIATLLTPFGSGAPAAAANTAALASALRISQVYGGGGNAGATYTHDFIEIFNGGTTPISLNGLSVQYASATGTGHFGANDGQITILPNVTLNPGQYYLIQQAGGSTGSPLPTPDLIDPTPINLGATAGKVIIANTTASLGCNGGSAPCSPAQQALIIDLVGYGNANFYEGTGPAPTLSNTTAALRAGNGCTDTDDNAADFITAAPIPRNTASPTHTCSQQGPAIFLRKTVGTDPTVCAPTDNTISVPAGTEVTYCYEVTNTGTVALDYHDLYDSELEWILEEFYFPLAPGASAFVTRTVPMYVTTVNTATWAAYNADFMDWVEATDVATVTVTAPSGPGAFCNLDPITITDSEVTPYPSAISVTGLGGVVTNVRVYLFDINHTFPDDLDILLVGPQGQNLIIMSDAGGGSDLVNVTLVFDDAAAGLLPDAAQIVSGMYLPTNYGTGDSFPAPAPAPSTATELAVFNGSDPNGTWQLFVVDDVVGDAGNINGGWCLQIDAEDMPTLPPNIDVDPLSLSSTQAPDTQVQQTLTIANTGEADLEWEIAEAPTAILRHGVASPVATRSRGGKPDATPPQVYRSLATLSEGFDDITSLPVQGWFFQNNSAPLGITNWFQGDPDEFQAHVGAPDAYIAANFENTADTGTISNWLLTPELALADGETFSFWTRTVEGSEFPDRLQLRLSLNGASTHVGTGATDVGDFTTLLLEINPTQAVGGYPDAWTQYSVTLSGIPEDATGRIAFRYFVTDAGPNGNTSNYIGIDTVEYTGDSLPFCQSPSDVPWLSLDTYAGTTAGGESTDVTVTFDSTGLSGGIYNANLCIFSNDPDFGSGNETGLVVVPVTLRVLQPAISLVKTVGTDPTVCATTNAITLPSGGGEVTYCYEVTNTGEVTLILHTLDDSELGTLFTGIPYTLGPGATTFFTATATVTVTTVNSAVWTSYNEGPTNVVTATAVATVTVVNPAISLVKTVGTVEGECADTDEITVPEGTTVYYCYTITNTGNVTLTFHDLEDDVLGEIFAGLNYVLDPGSSVNTVAAGYTVSATIMATTVNTATWTAYNWEQDVPVDEVTSTATARVNVEPTAVGVTRLMATPSGAWSSIALLGVFALGGFTWKRKRR